MLGTAAVRRKNAIGALSEQQNHLLLLQAGGEKVTAVINRSMLHPSHTFLFRNVGEVEIHRLPPTFPVYKLSYYEKLHLVLHAVL